MGLLCFDFRLLLATRQPYLQRKVDALDDGDEMKFADSVARFLNAAWERERTSDCADVPCRGALHYYRPVAGPVTRLVVVLPFAQAFLPFVDPGAAN